MTPLRLVAVVEGHGEERAVPALLRRWLRHRNLERSFQVPELAINAKGAGRLKAAFDRDRHRGIECWVSKALIAQPDAIVVILDADDECQQRVQGARARAGAAGTGAKGSERCTDCGGDCESGVRGLVSGQPGCAPGSGLDRLHALAGAAGAGALPQL
jgi:hypothetical protein